MHPQVNDEINDACMVTGKGTIIEKIFCSRWKSNPQLAL